MTNLGIIEETKEYQIFQAKYKQTVQLNIYCGGVTPQWIKVSKQGFMIKTNMTAN